MPPPEHSSAFPSEPAPPSPGMVAKLRSRNDPIHSGNPKTKDEREDDDLSEEDLMLTEQLELYVLRAQDPGVQKLALLRRSNFDAWQEIHSAASSMVFVPKPLKFIRPHCGTLNKYGTLKAYFETMPGSDLKKCMADILSVLPLTMYTDGEREILKYQMKGSEGEIGSCGHEYVRNLAGEIALGFQKRQYNDMPIDPLLELMKQIVPFNMKVEDVDLQVEHVDSTNYKRACLYLTSSSRYLHTPDVLALYMKFEDLASALWFGLLLDNKSQHVKQVFTANDHLKLQFAYIISHHGLSVVVDHKMDADENEENLQEIVHYTKLTEGYLTPARDIEDKFMIAPYSSGSGSSGHWLFNNKEHGKACATRSLGMILLWEPDSGLAQLDNYQHRNHVAAVALLGMGIVSCGVKNVCDPALAVISEYISREESIMRIGAILVLGIAYAGSHKDEVQNILGCSEHLRKGESHQGPAVLGIALIAMAEELGSEMAAHALEHLLHYGEQNIRRVFFPAIGMICVSNPKDNIQLFVKGVFSGTLSVQANPMQPLICLIRKIEERVGFVLSDQVATSNGRSLSFWDSLCSQQVQRDSHISLMPKMLGGWMPLGNYFNQQLHVVNMLLPNGLHYPSATRGGSFVMTSLLHLVTHTIANGRSWNGQFTAASFVVDGDIVRFIVHPGFDAEPGTIVNDLQSLAQLLLNFGLNGYLIPYLSHLLHLLTSYNPVGNDLEGWFKFLIEHHPALMTSKAREHIISDLAVLYSILNPHEMSCFEADLQALGSIVSFYGTSVWVQSTFADTVLQVPHQYRARKNWAPYLETNEDALNFMRNTTQHGPGSCWADKARTQQRYHYNNNIEVLLYINFGDFLAALLERLYRALCQGVFFYGDVSRMMQDGLARPNQAAMLSAWVFDEDE